MSGASGLTNGDKREQLEQRANAVRSRLSRRLDELGDRGERLRSLGKTLTSPPASIFLLGAVGVSLAAFVIYRRRHRPSGFERFLAQLRPPAPPPAEDSMLVSAIKRGAVSIVTLSARRLARQALAQLMQSPLLDDSQEGARAPSPVYNPPRP